MRMFLSLIAIWAPAVLAATHYMLVGTFSTNSIYTLIFDDETNELTEVANTSTPVSSSWLALSVSYHSVKHQELLLYKPVEF